MSTPQATADAEAVIESGDSATKWTDIFIS